jgi:hypothetical protein
VDPAARNLEDAIELSDIAERMVRARFRREHPSLSELEIETRVVRWLHERLESDDSVMLYPPSTAP